MEQRRFIVAALPTASAAYLRSVLGASYTILFPTNVREFASAIGNELVDLMLIDPCADNVTGAARDGSLAALLKGAPAIPLGKL